MSNLGGYQTLVKVAHMVGGPGNLVALAGGIFSTAGVLVTLGAQKTVSAVKAHNSDRDVFVASDSLDSAGLAKGQVFRVVSVSDGIVEIEVAGHEGVLISVPEDVLANVSEYRSQS